MNEIITGFLSVVAYRIIDNLLTPKIQGAKRFLLILFIILALTAMICFILKAFLK